MQPKKPKIMFGSKQNGLKVTNEPVSAQRMKLTFEFRYNLCHNWGLETVARICFVLDKTKSVFSITIKETMVYW